MSCLPSSAISRLDQFLQSKKVWNNHMKPILQLKAIAIVIHKPTLDAGSNRFLLRERDTPTWINPIMA
jgi:hypothetical protein